MIYIKKIGILNSGCDAVVNAANSNLLEGGGVCGAIFRAVDGDGLTSECRKIGHCDTGKAVITGGYNIAKYIIHAVGPIYKGGNYNESNDLYNCYVNSIELALKNNCKSICFPLISAGIYGYPVELAFNVAFSATKNFKDDLDIVFAIPDIRNYKIGLDIIQEKDLEIVIGD